VKEWCNAKARKWNISEDYRERRITEKGGLQRKEDYRERKITEKGRLQRKEDYRERKKCTAGDTCN